jgi:hypothetical protein
MKGLQKALLVLAVVSGAASADYSKQWCVGEHENECSTKPVYPCPNQGGPGAHAVAKDVCTITTPAGPKVKNYKLETMSTVGGAYCGYTVYKVTCLDN